MVDLVITPANVKYGADSSIERDGLAGATILAGQVVYLNQTTGRLGLADNNAPSPPEIKLPRGIALHGASLDQPLAILRAGDITIGATLVAGTDYYLGDTPGGICPRADVIASESVTLIGLATSTTVLRVNIQASGVTL
jgi:hypothetical protein